MLNFYYQYILNDASCVQGFVCLLGFARTNDKFASLQHFTGKRRQLLRPLLHRLKHSRL